MFKFEEFVKKSFPVAEYFACSPAKIRSSCPWCYLIYSELGFSHSKICIWVCEGSFAFLHEN